MPTPEAFKGLRKAFLEGEREGYKNAVANNTKKDFVMDVVRRFLKRFPLGLKDDEEPTAEYLATVDDAAPDKERVCPDPTDYPEDQQTYGRLLAEYDEATKQIATRTKQIARWLHSRLNKEESSKADGSAVLKPAKKVDLNDPLTILSLKILGEDVARPRKPTDFNVWAKDNADEVAKAYAIEAGVNKHRNNLKLRARIAQRLLSQKSDAVKAAYRKKAEEIHEEELAKWDAAVQGPVSTAPESRQVCINGATAVLGPIIDRVQEFTGMHVTLIMGGPEPKAGGRLNIISLHSGTTKGPVPLTFPEALSTRFNNEVLPVFSDFLRMCFTREDCQASALPSSAQSKVSSISSKQIVYNQATGDAYGQDNTSTTTGAAASPASTTSSNAVTTVSGGSEKEIAGNRRDKPSKEGAGVGIDQSLGGGSKKNTQRGSAAVKGSALSSTNQDKGRKGRECNNHALRPTHHAAEVSQESPMLPPSDVPNPPARSAAEADQVIAPPRPSNVPVPPSSPFILSPGFPFASSVAASSPRAPMVVDSPDQDASAASQGSHLLPSLPFASSPAGSPHQAAMVVDSSRHGASAASQRFSSLPSFPFAFSVTALSPQAAMVIDSPHQDASAALQRSSSPRSLPFASSEAGSLPLEAMVVDSSRQDASSASRRSPSLPSHPFASSPAGASPQAAMVVDSPGQEASAASQRSPRHSSNYDKGAQSSPIQSFSSPFPEGFPSSPSPAGLTSGVQALPRPPMLKFRPITFSTLRPLSPLSNRLNARKNSGSLVPKTARIKTRAGAINKSSDKENARVARKRKAASAVEDQNKENAGLSRKRKAASAVEDHDAKRRKVASGGSHSSNSKLSSSSSTNAPTVSSRIQALASTCITAKYLSTPDLFALMPEDCDPALINTLKMMKSVSWGMMWDILTVEWFRLEAIYGFKGNSKLKSQGRPQAVGQWIKRARSPNYKPDVDVKKFQADFWIWWCGLQPDWRTIEDGLAPTLVEGGWEVLDAPGPNGWPSVLVALYFWGLALGEERLASDSWVVAVEDASFVLTQICASHSE